VPRSRTSASPSPSPTTSRGLQSPLALSPGLLRVPLRLSHLRPSSPSLFEVQKGERLFLLAPLSLPLTAQALVFGVGFGGFCRQTFPSLSGPFRGCSTAAPLFHQPALCSFCLNFRLPACLQFQAQPYPPEPDTTQTRFALCSGKQVHLAGPDRQC